MSETGGGWDECPWDARRVRELVAGLVKSLVQARWKTDSNFLPPEQLAAWFPPDGTEVQVDPRPARPHLGYVKRDIGKLQRLGVLPDHGRCSAGLIPGPAAAGELVAAVERLLDADPALEDPVASLRAAFDESEGDPPGWVGLVAWGELPHIRTLLYAFPGDRPRWDLRARELWFEGRVVRRVVGQAVSQRRLLAAFEEQRWPDWMDSPFAATTDQLENALKRLNEKLSGLRFEKSPDNERVGWRDCAAAGRTKTAAAKRRTRR